jgi:hypothetical protein
MRTFKDRAKVFYRTYSSLRGFVTYRGVVVETYRRANGTWIIVHDKVRNRSLTVRPQQVSKTGVF